MTAPVRRFLQKGGRGGVFFLHGDDEFRKDEAVRDLCRAREDAKQDQTRARHHHGLLEGRGHLAPLDDGGRPLPIARFGRTAENHFRPDDIGDLEGEVVIRDNDVVGSGGSGRAEADHAFRFGIYVQDLAVWLPAMAIVAVLALRAMGEWREWAEGERVPGAQSCRARPHHENVRLAVAHRDDRADLEGDVDRQLGARHAHFLAFVVEQIDAAKADGRHTSRRWVTTTGS